jgi:hypothetical protein
VLNRVETATAGAAWGTHVVLHGGGAVAPVAVSLWTQAPGAQAPGAHRSRFLPARGRASGTPGVCVCMYVCVCVAGVYPGSCWSSAFSMRSSRTHRLSRRGPPRSVKIDDFHTFSSISLNNRFSGSHLPSPSVLLAERLTDGSARDLGEMMAHPVPHPGPLPQSHPENRINQCRRRASVDRRQEHRRQEHTGAGCCLVLLPCRVPRPYADGYHDMFCFFVS